MTQLPLLNQSIIKANLGLQEEIKDAIYEFASRIGISDNFRLGSNYERILIRLPCLKKICVVRPPARTSESY
jgi:hypothetical protein